MIKGKVLTFLLTLSFAVTCEAGTLKGAVVDSSGAAIPKSHIVIHWDPVGIETANENVGLSEDKVASADEKGQFLVDLPAGVYDVFVAAPGFFPHCEKIYLSRKQTRAYEVRLKPSRMLTIHVN